MSDENQAFASPEDEDLFDFPVSPAYADAQQPAAGGVPQPSEGAPKSVAQPKATEAQVGALLDPELDEDLFDFEPLYQATQPRVDPNALIDLETTDDVPLVVEPQPVAASANPLPTAQAPKSASKAQETPQLAPQSAPQSAPQAAPRARQRTTTSESTIPAAMWVPPQIDLGPEPKRGRLIELLALSFLVINSALVLLAWRAGDHFRETLAAVTRTVSDAVADGHAQGQASQPLVFGSGSQMGSAPVQPDVTTTEVIKQESPREQAPSDLLDLPQASLDLARERIRKGRYAEARRDLFRLLANRDRTALSDAMVVEAETLVAEAFAAQAQEVSK
ncbi:MAG: hypothetical protein H6830_09555 [Planctomycetes bacterium]|nr:hypothetical protein [Planctomycetota bacterium]MCB9909970.1 hypothetical protein [Planctomycetota bacterium]HPF12704.1 hypothetical protein [Planctomycetota bacterium]HRV80204.1 hypothetical protein [Planctomycetota bacterium]